MAEVRTRCVPWIPCWVSLMPRDPGTVRRFYGSLLGWDFTAAPTRLGQYTRAAVRGARVASFGPVTGTMGPRAEWLVYFSADDADRRAQRVRECGGTVAVGPLETGTVGRLAIASDFSGAVFGLWESGERLGWRLTGVAGAPCWTQLTTHDAFASARFYGEVFGWDAPCDGTGRDKVFDISWEGDRVTLRVEDEPVTGIRSGVGGAPLPPDMRSRWEVFFGVADVAETVRTAVVLGGTLARPVEETPCGSSAALRDPEGACFSVVQVPVG